MREDILIPKVEHFKLRQLHSIFQGHPVNTVARIDIRFLLEMVLQSESLWRLLEKRRIKLLHICYLW